jgi:hypothetical protein
MSYYYLISSLPELSPQMDTSKLDFVELFDSIDRNLSKQDTYLLKYLIYPNDLDNLLNVLSEKHQNRSAVDFKTPSVFEAEEVENYKKNRANFPDFMNDFLSQNEDRLSVMSRREMEDAMQERFYEEVFELNNAFLTRYYKFSRTLKSIIAAYNFNAYDFLSTPKVQEVDRLILQIGPGKSPSASVLKDYGFLEKLITALSENKPEQTERLIDRILWDFLDNTSAEPFSGEFVFAYTIKLQLLKRWHKIEQDSKSYEELLKTIINKNTSEKTLML